MRTCGFALALVLGLCDSSRAQQSLRLSFYPANESVLQNYSAEFPPIGAVYALMRSQVMADYAARLLRDAPAGPETFEMLVYLERRQQAADVLHRIIQSAPAQMERPFELLLSRNLFRSGGGGDGANPLPELIAEARSQFMWLPRASAARVERVLVLFEAGGGAPPRPSRSAALREFIARYAGTDAALEAEVDLITSSSNDRTAWIAPLDNIVRQHPGTTAAAKALFEKAFQLSTNLQQRGVDPTGQMLEVFAIVRDLESGRYPPCEWTAKAHWLGIELRLRPYLQQPIAPDNVERLLTAFVGFVQAHFGLPELGEAAAGLESMINGPIFDLFVLRSDGAGGVERMLSDLEGLDAPRAHYLRGAFYTDRLRTAPASEHAGLLQKAHQALTAASASGAGVYARRASATLASLDYEEGDFDSARARFGAYLSAFPSTTYAWVAAIRLGQCEQLLGDVDAAAAAFRDAATRYGGVSVAREVAGAYAGWANEMRSRFQDAVVDYERALAQWGDLRRSARMEVYRAKGAASRWTFVEVSGAALDARVSELRASLRFPEGAALERGRSALNDGRLADAVSLFDRFLVDYPQSSLAGDARRLSHRARLREAVDLARPSNAGSDAAAAVTRLAALARETADDITPIAQVVRATIVASQGDEGAAASLVTAVLRDWQRQQQTATRASSLAADIARDVAAIRTQVFDGSTSEPWRASFEWRPSTARYQVINPHIVVALAGGVPRRETVYPASTPENTLFLPSEQMSLLVESMNALTLPRNLLEFITGYLPVDQGMIGGLSAIASIPNVLSVTFTDEARTRAEVGIRTWSSGGTLRMEKQQDVWRVTGVAGAYVN
jgi:TolA-binding protein